MRNDEAPSAGGSVGVAGGRDTTERVQTVHDALYEQVAVRRHGQSAYAPPGQRSEAQRKHDARELMDLIQRVSFAAGRAEGYAVGYEQGHRSGRMGAWRAVGPQALIDVIRRDLDAILGAVQR